VAVFVRGIRGYSPPQRKERTTGVWLFSRDAANVLRKRYGLPEFTQADEK
jgi:hypothetical protein